MNIHYLVVKQSDLYPAAHFRSGLFFTTLAVIAMYYLPLSWLNPFPIIAVGAGAFLFGYLLAHLRRFKRLFSFGHEMKEEVHQMALESLETYGLLGQKKTIFLYASLLEKRLECLPSYDLGDALDYKRILKKAKGEFKKRNPKLVLEEICRDMKTELSNHGSPSEDFLPQIQESLVSSEQTRQEIENRSDSNLLETDEGSLESTEKHQNSTEDSSHPQEPPLEKE